MTVANIQKWQRGKISYNCQKWQRGKCLTAWEKIWQLSKNDICQHDSVGNFLIVVKMRTSLILTGTKKGVVFSSVCTYLYTTSTVYIKKTLYDFVTSLLINFYPNQTIERTENRNSQINFIDYLGSYKCTCA